MDQPPLLPGSERVAPAHPETSLLARLLNVFAVPGEVFEEVKAARAKVVNWLVPILLYGVVGAVASVLILSQPAVIQQIHDRQAKAIEQEVKAGKMSRADADKALSAARQFSSPVLMKSFGAIGAFFATAASVFGWGLVLWLIGRFCLKTPLSFMKMVEVAGLASAISMLETVVRMLLIVGFRNPLASPSLAMLLTHPDPSNQLFSLLSVLNIMTIWALVVRAIGLAKFSGVPFSRAAMWVFAFWILLMSGLLAATAGFQGLGV